MFYSVRLFVVLIVSTLFILCSCSKKQIEEQPLTPDMEATLTVWAGNVAGKGLEATVESFNEKYPNVKVDVVDIGGEQARDKLTIGLAAGAGLPDVIQVESQYMETFCGKFPQGFVDLTNRAEKYVKDFDSSKWAQSRLNGKILSIPWDSGPVAVFYRRDYFEKAGVDPDDIKIWDDYIEAGKKVQAANKGVKMLILDYSNDDSLFRILLNQQGIFYFNEKGEIALESYEALQALKLIKNLVDTGLTINNTSWDVLIRNAKNGKAATIILGVWWGGTMIDQMPELSGKWGVFKLPAFDEGGCRASNLGGSTLAIPAQCNQKKLAWEFIENALITKENQLLMFEECSLFPSYVPAYESPVFDEGNEYFAGQNINRFFADITNNIPEAYYTSDFNLANQTVINGKSSVLLEGVAPKKALENMSKRLKIFTGREIEYSQKFQETE